MKIMFAVSLSDERFKCVPDLGLGYMAALAREKGHEVCIVDNLLEELTFEDFEAQVRAFNPDVIGFKAFSIDLEYIQEYIQRIHAISPKIVSVVGGPHPSTERPERLFEQLPGLHFGFAGEGEPGFPAFIERLAAGATDFSGIAGLIWRDATGKVHHNGKAYVEDLDSVPFPAWDLIDPRRYRYGFSFMTRKYPVAPMAITRGCPYLCTFCGAHLLTGRKLRARSVDNVIEEMKMLKRDYGVRSIDVVDENFTFLRDFVLELCERMIQENLKLEWNCPQGVRLDRLDEEIVRMMERAGCIGVSLGLESGSKRILKMIKKAQTPDEIVEQVNMIKRVSKLRLLGMFMVGFPGETREEVESTIELALSLPLDIAVFSPLRATPGTEIYENLVKAGVIYPRTDYDDFGRPYFMRSYCDIPDDELRALYRKAYLKFYTRPRVVWNLTRQIRSWAQFRSIVDGMSRMIKRPVSKYDPRRKATVGVEEPAS